MIDVYCLDETKMKREAYMIQQGEALIHGEQYITHKKSGDVKLVLHKKTELKKIYVRMIEKNNCKSLDSGYSERFLAK